MLLEIAIGDAFAAPYEFSGEKIKKIEKYKKVKKRKKGTYTDDTQMSIAIAETMLEKGLLYEEMLSHKFWDCYRRDPRLGYATGFQKFLETVESGKEFLLKINPNSDRSGAAMRSVPLGLLPTAPICKFAAKFQAKITHDTLSGIESSEAVALASFYGYHNVGKKVHMRDFVNAQIRGFVNWAKDWKGVVENHGIHVAKAALTAVANNNTMSDILLDCVNFKGDVDSVAAIALGIASHFDCIENDLPKSLYKKLENDDYGKDYIMSLDKKLKKRFPRVEANYFDGFKK